MFVAFAYVLFFDIIETVLKPLLAAGVSDKCATGTSAQVQALSREGLPGLRKQWRDSHTGHQGSLYSHRWGREAGLSSPHSWGHCHKEQDLSSGMTAWHWHYKRVTFNLFIWASLLPSRPGHCPRVSPAAAVITQIALSAPVSISPTNFWRAGSPPQPQWSARCLEHTGCPVHAC